jgi:3-hydroxymyristoyl/3-hydroxydecanoyl-(acyl carrier protein) dehydratase
LNFDVRSDFAIPPDHPCLEGHFPGNPIVPGVVILDEVAALLEQVQPEHRIARVVQAKFLSILRPGEVCEIRLSPGKLGSVRFECHAGGRLIASGALVVGPERVE